jgi:hypothetical protein
MKQCFLQAELSHDESLIASPRLLPGNSYKHLDDARGEGSLDCVSSDVMRFNSDATIEAFPACQIKGL